MRRNSSLSSLIILIVLVSCNNLVFDKPQPVEGRSVTKLAKVFSGTYLSPDNDTLRITENSISISNSQRNVITAELGTDMEAREYSSGYVINIPDSVNGKRVWVAYIFKIYNDSLRVSYADYGADKLKRVEDQVRNITSYEVIRNEIGEYQRLILKPKNSNQFERVVNGGLFNKTVTFRQENQQK